MDANPTAPVEKKYLISKWIHNQMQRGHNKLHFIELLRFISAFSVLIWHYQHFFIGQGLPVSRIILSKQPFYEILEIFYIYGFYGVQVFWIISGFIFFYKYQDIVHSRGISLKNFLILRFSRIYPLHFITLIYVLLFQAIYFYLNSTYYIYKDNDIPHFIAQLFLASDWGFMRGESFNGPIWSISAEVLVYGFFYFIAYNIRGYFIVNILIISICVVTRYLGYANQIINCLTFFYIGGLSAIAWRYTNAVKQKNAFMLAIYILIIETLFIYFTKLYEHKYFPIIFLITYIPIILFMAAFPTRLSARIKNLMEILGNITYSSYLLQFPLQLTIVIFYIFNGANVPFESNTFFLSYISVTLFLAYYIYNIFEVPSQMVIRKKLGL